MVRAREQPYIWATWLSRLLAGESHCEWAAWFRAHYQDWERPPSDFDQTRWMMDHTGLVNQARESREKTRIYRLHREPEFLPAQGSHRHPGREAGPDRGQGLRRRDHRRQDRQAQPSPRRPSPDLYVRRPPRRCRNTMEWSSGATSSTPRAKCRSRYPGWTDSSSTGWAP